MHTNIFALKNLFSFLPFYLFALSHIGLNWCMAVGGRNTFLPLSEDWGRLVTSSVTARASEGALAATAVAEASFATSLPFSFLFVIFGGRAVDVRWTCGGRAVGVFVILAYIELLATVFGIFKVESVNVE